VIGAPADCLRRARGEPDLRPSPTTKNQRFVVRQSSIGFSTRVVDRAVSKPKVGMPFGSGRSLSIVFGTWATFTRPFASIAMRLAEEAVSSPPIVTR
jgi:hypothetical protein